MTAATGISNRDIVRFVEFRIGQFNTDLRALRDEVIQLFQSKVPGKEIDFQLELELGKCQGRMQEIGSLFEHLGERRLDESDGSSRFYDTFLQRFGQDLSEQDSIRIRTLFRKMSKGVDLYLNFLQESHTYIKEGYKGLHPVGELLIEKAERVSRLINQKLIPAKLNKCLKQGQEFMEHGVLSEIQFKQLKDVIHGLRDEKPISIRSDNDPEPEIDPILDNLHTVVQGLSSLSEVGFIQVFEPLSRLSELKGTLRTWEGEEKEISSRIYFHLHQIHLKEREEIIDPQNPDWGFLAFQNEEFTTELERLRAAQRTYVEFLFSRIREAMNHSDTKTECRLWDHLDGIGPRLDGRDVPPGVWMNRIPKSLGSLNRLQQKLVNYWTVKQGDRI